MRAESENVINANKAHQIEKNLETEIISVDSSEELKSELGNEEPKK